MLYVKAVYLLDLCILSYQLHSQTLIWPMDPYYEQLSEKSEGLRVQFMTDVANQFAGAQLQGTGRYHGRADFFGAGNGWNPNTRLDPLVSEYGRINPWRPSFTRPERGEWLLYNTPSVITDRIGTVQMMHYPANQGPGPLQPVGQGAAVPAAVPVLQGLPFPLQNPTPGAHHDVLYGFEGGTGAAGRPVDEAAWSLMGFVLAEFTAAPPSPYDVYVVFRGSRSGKRRIPQYLNARGNPDWVTDLDLTTLVQDPAISAYGSVCRGFAASMKGMLPVIVKCLEDLDTNHGAPRTISVTGHSLGGALAAHFASAMILGTHYGPDGSGNGMPGPLRAWPWRAMQLTTFSAPVVGGKTFRRLFDQTIPSARIWLDGDPITQEQLYEPVGVPLRVRKYDRQNRRKVVVGTTHSHEPYVLRRNIIRDWIVRYGNASVANVPANTGRPASDEPWQVFNSFQGLMDRLTGFRGILANQNTPGFFSGFQTNFDNYVVTLAGLVAANQNQFGALNALQNQPANAGTINQWQGFLTTLQAQLTNGQPLGAKMWDFVATCYLMSLASASFAAFRQASTGNGFLQRDYAGFK